MMNFCTVCFCKNMKLLEKLELLELPLARRAGEKGQACTVWTLDASWAPHREACSSEDHPGHGVNNIDHKQGVNRDHDSGPKQALGPKAAHQPPEAELLAHPLGPRFWLCHCAQPNCNGRVGLPRALRRFTSRLRDKGGDRAEMCCLKL